MRIRVRFLAGRWWRALGLGASLLGALAAGSPAAAGTRITTEAVDQYVPNQCGWGGALNNRVANNNGFRAGMITGDGRWTAGANYTPVPDSVAWARFNANDDVVAETVYWPPIPAAVLQEAESLKAAASAPAWAQTVADKLPKGATGPGNVVIRHTSFAHRGAFWARAAYDVGYKSGGFAVTRHFDAAGNEFKTPEEQQTYPDASTK